MAEASQTPEANQMQSFSNPAFANLSVGRTDAGANDSLAGPVNTVKPPGSPP